MANFSLRHINRLQFPDKAILVCEDDIHNQKRILNRLHQLFHAQGLVEIYAVPSGIAAAVILQALKHIKLILLDHDMPYGNGTDLINWMSEFHYKNHVITFSGIPENNVNMSRLLSMNSINYHQFNKEEVIAGEADEIIKSLCA